MLFAGGASLKLIISCALAATFADHSPWPRDAVPWDELAEPGMVKQIAWETIRYFPAVVGFPWFEGGGALEKGSKRVCLCLAAALKDPRVWGADAEEFKLRPLAEYHKLSTAFARVGY